MAARTPDVLIVGGGLIGCSCAYHLASRGLSVTLLERSDLASGASGACDGHVCCQSKTSPAHLALAQRSVALYESLSHELDAPTGYRRTGSWLIAETDEELAGLRRHAIAMSAAGLGVGIHPGVVLRKAEPTLSGDLVGGAHCPTDGQTDPWRTTLAFASAARRLGADIRLHVEARDLAAVGRRVIGARTDSETIHAGHTLLAAGAWTSALCVSVNSHIPLQPRRGEVLVSEPMPPLLSAVILHAPYGSSKTANGAARPATLVLEQLPEGNILIGSTREYAGSNARTTAVGPGAIAHEAARLAPGIAELAVVRTFAGLRPCSGDGMPLIGPAPGIDNLFLATGHEGDGIALGPITGQIVADGIADSVWEPDLLPSRLTPTE